MIHPFGQYFGCTSFPYRRLSEWSVRDCLTSLYPSFDPQREKACPSLRYFCQDTEGERPPRSVTCSCQDKNTVDDHSPTPMIPISPGSLEPEPVLSVLEYTQDFPARLVDPALASCSWDRYTTTPSSRRPRTGRGGEPKRKVPLLLSLRSERMSRANSLHRRSILRYASSWSISVPGRPRLTTVLGPTRKTGVNTSSRIDIDQNIIISSFPIAPFSPLLSWRLEMPRKTPRKKSRRAVSLNFSHSSSLASRHGTTSSQQPDPRNRSQPRLGAIPAPKHSKLRFHVSRRVPVSGRVAWCYTGHAFEDRVKSPAGFMSQTSGTFAYQPDATSSTTGSMRCGEHNKGDGRSNSTKNSRRGCEAWRMEVVHGGEEGTTLSPSGRSASVHTRRASSAGGNSSDLQQGDAASFIGRRHMQDRNMSTPRRLMSSPIRSPTKSAIAAESRQVPGDAPASYPIARVSQATCGAATASRDLLEPLRAKGREYFSLKRSRSSESGSNVDEQGEEVRRIGSPHRLIRRNPITEGASLLPSSLCPEEGPTPPMSAGSHSEENSAQRSTRGSIDRQRRKLERAPSRDMQTILEEDTNFHILGEASGDNVATRSEGSLGGGVACNPALGDGTLPADRRRSRACSSDPVGTGFSRGAAPVNHSLKVQRLDAAPRLDLNPKDPSPIDRLTNGVQSLGVISPGASVRLEKCTLTSDKEGAGGWLQWGGGRQGPRGKEGGGTREGVGDGMVVSVQECPIAPGLEGGGAMLAGTGGDTAGEAVSSGAQLEGARGSCALSR